ncbi:GNAT family N-acetyltransferase [Arthrobacter sp. L77]|uniref:GNAT family N-acetyltransferase n=1 Tax=Arthrobacter sp. L77 TaxID=1496689 RepID=UPI0005BDEBF6|nr:N-acetyltransferase [Arthrobacter sp. L77]
MTEPSTVSDITSAADGPALHILPTLPTVADGPDPDVVVPPTKREREAHWMEDAAALDVGTASPADLRGLANRMFRLLDAAFPPDQAGERYAAAVGEIERRARRVAAHPDTTISRGVVKDSAFGSRFELFVDGGLAAYLEYSMLGGQLTLRALVGMPGCEQRGLGRVLMRHAVLSAHKRRLDLVAGCEAARLFLQQNPQYRTLARTS